MLIRIIVYLREGLMRGDLPDINAAIKKMHKLGLAQNAFQTYEDDTERDIIMGDFVGVPDKLISKLKIITKIPVVDRFDIRVIPS